MRAKPVVTIPIYHLCLLSAFLAVALLFLPGAGTGVELALADLEEPPTTEPPTEIHYIYLPLTSRAEWQPVALQNASFEGEWWRQTFTGQEFNELAVPVDWIAFWREGYPFGRPEMAVIPSMSPYVNPPRIHSGYQALKYFTVWRLGDTGVFQQVSVPSGARLHATAFVHVWYSTQDDPYFSQWDRDGVIYTLQDGDPGMDAMLGIDPTGGTDPWASSVVWGRTSIYDQYDKVEVLTQSQATTVTLFLRTLTLYPYKHCDAYWDSVTLEALH